MSLLDHARTGPAADDPVDDDRAPRRLLGRLPTRSFTVIGVLAALQAALGTWLVVAAPTLLLWAGEPRAATAWPDAVRVATDIWLVGHGTTVVLPTGEFSLVPLGLTVGIVWWARRCVDRVLDLCDDGTGTARAVVLRAGAAFVPAYAAAVAVAAALVGTPTARPMLGSAVLSGLVVAALAVVISGYSLWQGEGPRWVRLHTVGRAVALALRCWCWAAVLLLALSVLTNWGRIRQVQDALQPETTGVLGLLLLQAVLLPTATVWAGSWLTGPGFSVGAGTSLTPFGTELAPVPALPLLGALPHAGSGSVAAWFAPLLVVLAGVAAGVLLSRQPVDRVDQRWWISGMQVALGAGALALPLLWASSGSVGPDRLAEVGPRVLLVTLALVVEVGIGAMLGAGLAPLIVDGRAGQAVERFAAQAWRSDHPLVHRAGAWAGNALQWARARSRQTGDLAAGARRSARTRWAVVLDVLRRRR